MKVQTWGRGKIQNENFGILYLSSQVIQKEKIPFLVPWPFGYNLWWNMKRMKSQRILYFAIIIFSNIWREPGGKKVGGWRQFRRIKTGIGTFTAIIYHGNGGGAGAGLKQSYIIDVAGLLAWLREQLREVQAWGLQQRCSVMWGQLHQITTSV